MSVGSIAEPSGRKFLESMSYSEIWTSEYAANLIRLLRILNQACPLALAGEALCFSMQFFRIPAGDVHLPASIHIKLNVW